MALGALLQILWSTFEDHLTAHAACLGTEVDNPVGTLYHIHIVLHDNDSVTVGNQGIERLEQTLYVVEMQTRGRLIEDEHYLFGVVILR